MKKPLILFAVFIITAVAIGQTAFGPPQTIAGTNHWFMDLCISDLDMDGANDVIVNDWGNLYWYKNLGNGNFGNGINFYTGSFEYGSSLVSDDLDNDGDKDGKKY